jgi:vacuolar-type H+-ATPase subunit H
MHGAEATPEDTLLQIKRKEIELQALLLSARTEADEVVAAARDEAATLRREGQAAADAEAALLRAAELAAARAAAERIRHEYDERIAALRRDDDVIGRLAERIRRAVAPGSG